MLSSTNEQGLSSRDHLQIMSNLNIPVDNAMLRKSVYSKVNIGASKEQIE